MVELNTDHAARVSSQWVEFAKLVCKWKRVLVVAPVLVALIVAGALQFVPNQYTAVLKIAPSQTVQLYKWALNESGLTKNISAKFGLEQHYGVASALAAREKLMSHVQFVSNLQDNFVDVRVTDKDPQLAKDIANAYGDGMVDLLIGLHMTEASNAIYGLQSMRERAEKNLVEAKAKLAQPDIATALPHVSTSIRLGLVGMSGIQAETTLAANMLGGADSAALTRQTLDQSEMVRVQERLAGIQRALSDDIEVKKSGVAVSNLVAAVDALQDQAYWEAMVNRIDRRIDVLTSTAKGEIRLIHATTPEEVSGPRRIMLAVSTGIATLLVLLVCIVGSEQFKRMQRAREN